MTIQEYVKAVEKLYYSGKATEHSYRSALQRLVENYGNNVVVTNEPKRVKCGAPDYIITKKDIPIGYIEAKDVIGGILDKKDTKAQVKRYFNGGLGYNFILTDYLEFRFYREENLVETIRIAEPNGKALILDSDKYDHLGNLLSNFCQYHGQTITSSRKLAEMMAAKARMIQTVIFNALQDEEDGGGELRRQFEAFQNILMHDMTEKQFSDMYAQTITYGLFAARLHDPTLKTFSRMEAAELLPRTNPFLRQLFGQIGAINLDTRLQWIVDDLVELFKACDVREILEDYGKVTQRNDPIVHFYEDFLAEYDSKLRKSRGVWYTPEPVVDFIVRAVDEVLKTEFGLADGLADTSQTKMKVKVRQYAHNRKKDYREEYIDTHRVQILDPATGTGTFLARVFQEVYSRFENMPALWKGYVNKDLLPRIHGFEILMASYAMAHLKLDLVLRETGAKPDKRFNVFLTNSLEEAHPDTGTLFAQWLSRESEEANRIKQDMPIMCIIGNPPYSISSSNKGEWIERLMETYKKGLNERNIQPLSDDYIKFIRYGQNLIEKTGEGVLAFITNNSFLDGVIHSAMRKSLYNNFDKIYILDLHGSTKRREMTDSGKPDKNVFDIQPGVSISIFVKRKGIKKSLKVFDLLGSRKEKYEFCLQNSLSSIKWQEVRFDKNTNDYLFKYRDNEVFSMYQNFIELTSLFRLKTSGIKTHRDHLVIDSDKRTLLDRIKTFYSLDHTDNEIASLFNLKDNRDWKIDIARAQGVYDPTKLEPLLYRPFDLLKIYYDKNLIDFGREKTIYHLQKENFGLILVRQSQAINTRFFDAAFITNNLADTNNFRRGGPLIFPIYLYPETQQLSLDHSVERKPNLDPKIVSKVSEKLSLRFIPDHALPEAEQDGTFTPLDLLDYIYAVLHSPNYREKYKEFLKIDFPRIPYPEDQETFWKLVKLGSELRAIHLMKSPALDKANIRLDGGDNLTVEKTGSKTYDPGTLRVYINDEVYFEGVPELAWEFYIGGYQPAQKWLKDRKGRALDYNDVKHYMKIIVALVETDRIMKEIDAVNEF
ncbi:type ISP restriction/modification enzyme [Lewinella sp. W8]|uniref:type ISP restriction/modification enzyme n=1 Tax=Lewinella sp. W8 TaxID=2528208 RepID=UPI001067A3C5|nr:type ISP restriction/modification enzyme [Lewinella sp. W8]MTB53940.1 N-6 DNA methylase [Lewinella sp. W8]